MLMPRSSRNDQNISTRTANPSPNPCATYEDAFRKRFASLDEFLSCWNAAGAKQAIVEELAAEGASLDAIADELAGPEPSRVGEHSCETAEVHGRASSAGSRARPMPQYGAFTVR